MSQYRYFSEYQGQPIELRGVTTLENAKFEQLFPGVEGRRPDSFRRVVGKAEDGTLLPVLRAIDYKDKPSRHVCDNRCLHAKGKSMKCECSCGGRYHGRGTMVCVAA